jgi:hypothetical protein
MAFIQAARLKITQIIIIDPRKILEAAEAAGH